MASGKYQFKSGARIKGLNPEQTHSEFERVRRKHGRLKAELIVEESKNKGSYLHNYFTWDNSKAGKLYRIEEAKKLIRSLVRVRIVSRGAQPPKQVTVRVYESLGKGFGSDARNQFFTTEEIMSDVQKRQQLLGKVWLDLLNLKQKYLMLTEFQRVWDCISELEREGVRGVPAEEA